MGRPVTQWQILAKEPERLAAFYTALFDWQVRTDNQLNYRTVDTGSPRGAQGGIWPAPPEGHSMAYLFVEVDDVPAHVERARALGAHVVTPPQVLPDGDEMAMILDPEGIPMGLWKPRSRAAR